MNAEKIIVLAKHFDVGIDEIGVSKYDENLFEVGNEEYLVLTDKEADELCKEQILDSLWAFRASFILSHSKVLQRDEYNQIALEKMQSELSESANDLVRALITDLDQFADDAIAADGRGHFLSSYDGKENAEGEFFIYRTN